MNKPEVLVVPSWYPTSFAPFVGGFFRDQAKLVADDFDIKVIYGSQILIGKKAFLKNIAKGKVTIPSSLEMQHHLLSPPEVIHFKYQVWAFLSLRKQLNQAADAYLNALSHYKSEYNWTPKLIHAHDVFQAGYIAKHLSMVSGIPYLLTQHSPVQFHLFSEAQQQIFKEVFENAARVLSVSNADARNTLFLDIDFQPQVIGNLVDGESYCPATLNARDTLFRIFFLGTYSKRKDIPTFLKAIRLLLDQGHSDIEILIQLGGNFYDGITPEQVDKLIKELDIVAYCRVRNDLTHDEKVLAYQNSNVFVSTSYYETFGLAVCEAMACGTPVVAVKNGGIEDIITPDNGVLVAIKDAEAIAKALADIKEGRQVFESEKVRSSVISKYGNEAFRKALYSAYQNLLN
jgi:glycosyltransferase involved in cell wall biosynthesis